MKNRLFQVCTYEKQQKVHIGHSACMISHLACEESALRFAPVLYGEGCQAKQVDSCYCMEWVLPTAKNLPFCMYDTVL